MSFELLQRRVRRLETRPYFLARQTGSVQSIPNSTKTTILLTEEIDPYGVFDNNTFTVPPGLAGTYVFFGSILMNLTTTATTLRGFITLNDSTTDIASGSQDGIAAVRSIPLNGMRVLAVGDVVNLKVTQANGGALAQDLVADPEHTYFGGYKIG